MSLISSLYTGASGLEANSQDLSVIGDNIANANTIGFKGGRAAFEDALSQSLIGGQGQIGLGTRLQMVQKLLAQGALANTGIATDLALQGNGFFIVKGQHNGQDASFYTRAGQFTVDDSGMLTNLEGLRVQGYGADVNGVINGTAGDISVGDATSPPSPTANITLKGNLQADAIVPAAWDPADPSNTSNFSTSTTVYDSLGQAHSVNVYFRKNGAGDWEWHAMTDGAGVSGGTAGTPSEIATGTLTYDTDGKMTGMTQSGSFTPAGATGPQALTFNLGDPSGTGGTGVAGMTQFANASTVTFANQDGYGAGELSRVNIDSNGRVMGTFSNGQTRALGQVVVADFQAADQLDRAGGNLFLANSRAGDPTIGTAGEGGRGAIVAGALEQSNIDLAGEFVRMIAAQRGFQANSKTISTADQLLTELISLKR